MLPFFYSANTSGQNSSATTGSNVNAISLPKGGEEVLINGSGHHRSRSSGRYSSRHHYAKHLFTSNSIDVSVTSNQDSSTNVAELANKSNMDSELVS